MGRSVLWSVMLWLGVAPVAWAATAKAVLSSTTQSTATQGEATFTETDQGLNVSLRMMGAKPGVHAFHVHEFGSCDEAAKAAGGHFNPDGVAHGDLAAQGLAVAHAGDLGNLTIGPDGTGTLERVYPGLRVADSHYGVAGRTLILHAGPDDLTSQPSGNAGERMACGPILITGN